MGAIFYHPDAYSVRGRSIMGRRVAGESFLQGFLRHSRPGDIWAQIARPEDAQELLQSVRVSGRKGTVRLVQATSLGDLQQPGSLFVPGPGLGDYARQRSAFGNGAWSLCGVTHTTSSAHAMDAIVELVTAPVQPWDALICTSAAVKDNVERVLQAEVDYLQQRLGITKLVLPQLPVVPLGIDTSVFAFDDAAKQASRSALGIAEDELVVLYVGRLSFHAKAHPFAMYRALEAASAKTGRKVVLIECGWHSNDFIKSSFEQGAALACPNVRVIVLDGRRDEERRLAWSGADIFCSLSDNIQETFGITPVEAMAAGLPAIVSDWDGYRDTVRDGVEGFRIPTTMPTAGLGGDLALRHALGIDSYDMYCGHTCSLVAVDIEEASAKFALLLQSDELRQKMGEAGRLRAKTVYDWRVIIPQYEALWEQLADLRHPGAASQPQLPYPWPARADPFHIFQGYPTHKLLPETMLALVDHDLDAARRRLQNYRDLSMVNFARNVLPSDEELDQVLATAAVGPVAASTLVSSIDGARGVFVFRALAWLLKIGILRLEQSDRAVDSAQGA